MDLLLRESRVVLLVSPIEGDGTALGEILGRPEWNVRQASSLREAAELLLAERIPVIVCQRDLPDGDWIALLTEFEKIANPPRLVVSCRLADEVLWSEVLHRGGHDVLYRPFEESEARRVISSAWGAWVRESTSYPQTAYGAGG